MDGAKVTMAYVKFHWDSVYTLTSEKGKYTARAKFGRRDLLEAGTPAELLARIHQHYPGPASDMCST
jgi:hypothetical protein